MELYLRSLYLFSLDPLQIFRFEMVIKQKYFFILRKASNLDEKRWLPEIQTLTVNIPFNRESLGNYTCMAIDPNTEEILHQDTVVWKC